MAIRVAAILLACAAALAVAPPAHAQPKKPPAARPPPDPRMAEAKRYFDDGAAAYALGNYEAAIHAWEKSYEISGKALIFESIANAWERLGDVRKARDNLMRWREAAPPEERDLLDARIRNLDARVTAQDAAAQAAAVAQAAREAQIRAVANAPDPRPWLPGAIVGGVGVLAVIAGVGVDAAAAKNRPSSSACKNVGGQNLCMTSAEGAITSSNRMAIAGDVTWILGTAAVAAGAVLVVVRRPRQQDSAAGPPAAYLAPAPGGIVLGGSF